jgi:membrane dipeptidase
VRSFLIRTGIALLGLLFVFLGIGPHIADRSMNKVTPTEMLTVSPAIEALLSDSTVIDLHADSLLWRRDLNRKLDHGHVDAARMRAGGMALQVFSSVTKTPKHQNYESNGGDTDNITGLVVAQLQPPRTWTSLLERSLYHAAKLNAAARASHGGVRVIKTVSDLDALMADRKRTPDRVGGMLSVEGLQDIEGQLANVDRLHAAGFRMLGLTHFFDNEVAGSVHGLKKYGLTPLGKQVIARMEATGMVVDVAHASHQTVAEVLAIATKPVVFSHGGVKGTCNTNRNLTDAEIRGIAKTGGIIGIGYWETAICDASPKGIARAMTYVRDLAGAQAVALGSDYDGAVTAPFDVSRVGQVAQALHNAGWTDGDIQAAMGGNAVRVFRATLPKT